MVLSRSRLVIHEINDCTNKGMLIVYRITNKFLPRSELVNISDTPFKYSLSRKDFGVTERGGRFSQMRATRLLHIVLNSVSSILIIATHLQYLQSNTFPILVEQHF